MCNLYSIGKNPNPDRVRWEKALREALELMQGQEKLKLYGIRPTDPGVVVKARDGGFQVEGMRWGFKRPQAPSINNSRGDKLDKRLWAKPFQENRCLVPANCFYEWSGPKGQKQAHAFQRPDRGWMWVAGIWEENAGLGPCYSMITTPANALMEPIHNRMPAVLDDEAAARYLQGEFAPRDFEAPITQVEELVTFTCENPLKMKSPILEPVPITPRELEPRLVQDELF